MSNRTHQKHDGPTRPAAWRTSARPTKILLAAVMPLLPVTIAAAADAAAVPAPLLEQFLHDSAGSGSRQRTPAPQRELMTETRSHGGSIDVTGFAEARVPYTKPERQEGGESAPLLKGMAESGPAVGTAGSATSPGPASSGTAKSDYRYSTFQASHHVNARGPFVGAGGDVTLKFSDGSYLRTRGAPQGPACQLAPRGGSVSVVQGETRMTGTTAVNVGLAQTAVQGEVRQGRVEIERREAPARGAAHRPQGGATRYDSHTLALIAKGTIGAAQPGVSANAEVVASRSIQNTTARDQPPARGPQERPAGAPSEPLVTSMHMVLEGEVKGDAAIKKLAPAATGGQVTGKLEHRMERRPTGPSMIPPGGVDCPPGTVKQTITVDHKLKGLPTGLSQAAGATVAFKPVEVELKETVNRCVKVQPGQKPPPSNASPGPVQRQCDPRREQHVTATVTGSSGKAQGEALGMAINGRGVLTGTQEQCVPISSVGHARGVRLPNTRATEGLGPARAADVPSGSQRVAGRPTSSSPSEERPPGPSAQQATPAPRSSATSPPVRSAPLGGSGRSGSGSGTSGTSAGLLPVSPATRSPVPLLSSSGGPGGSGRPTTPSSASSTGGAVHSSRSSGPSGSSSSSGASVRSGSSPSSPGSSSSSSSRSGPSSGGTSSSAGRTSKK